MKGEKIYNILNSLESPAFSSSEILSRIFDVSKSASQKMQSGPCSRKELKKEKKYKEYNNQEKQYYYLMSHLKHQGLMRKTDKGWIRTSLGDKKLKQLRTKLTQSKKNHVLEKAKNSILIIFDIPEKERWKRDWLRSCLINMGFRKIQRSVWIGEVKLPQEFIKDLKRYGLLSSVKIFSVTKKQTLTEQ